VFQQATSGLEAVIAPRLKPSSTIRNTIWFMSTAVMVGDRYVVAGAGSVSPNTTHPSPLDNGHLKFLLYLTPELLPEKEEILLPGPIEQETHIQVWNW